MIPPHENDGGWLNIIGAVITLLIPVAIAVIVILTGIGAYTVFTWLA